MERTIVLVTVRGGVVQDVQSTDAGVIVVIKDYDSNPAEAYSWPDTQWGEELDDVLKELGLSDGDEE